MNLTNYEKTPIFRVFEVVKREAARYGVSVLESEIVGLVPSAALTAGGGVLPAARGVHGAAGAGEQTTLISWPHEARRDTKATKDTQ